MDQKDRQRKKKDTQTPNNKRSRDEGGCGGGRFGQTGRDRGRFGGQNNGHKQQQQSIEINGNKCYPVHEGSKHKWKEYPQEI